MLLFQIGLWPEEVDICLLGESIVDSAENDWSLTIVNGSIFTCDNVFLANSYWSWDNSSFPYRITNLGSKEQRTCCDEFL